MKNFKTVRKALLAFIRLALVFAVVYFGVVFVTNSLPPSEPAHCDVPITFNDGDIVETEYGTGIIVSLNTMGCGEAIYNVQFADVCRVINSKEMKLADTSKTRTRVLDSGTTH